MATARTPDPQVIEQQTAAAKEHFRTKYQGATVKVHTVLHHRPVIRGFRRYFAIAMRNWHLATMLTRTALGNAAGAVKVQDAMLKKIADGTRLVRDRLAQFQHIVAPDPTIDMTTISHGGASLIEETIVLGPVAMNFRNLFLLCDQYLDQATVLYTYGLIPEDEFQSAQYEVKKILRGVETSIRNFRVMALRHINDAGKSRPGYVKSEEGEVVAPPDASSASDEAEIVPGSDIQSIHTPVIDTVAADGPASDGTPPDTDSEAASINA